MKHGTPVLYLIPGLGADERVFDELARQGITFQTLKIIPPQPGETLESYAGRMLEQIDTTEPFILGGQSFGGILAHEMARKKQPLGLLLISTVKNQQECPAWFKVLRKVPLHKMAPVQFLAKLGTHFLLTRPSQERKRVRSMIASTDKQFFRWAVSQALNWNRTEPPVNYFHIHGTHDHLFPARRISNAKFIPRGGHNMVIAQAKATARMLNQYLSTFVSEN